MVKSFVGSCLELSADSKGKFKCLFNYPDTEGDKATTWNNIWGKEGEAMIGKASNNRFETLNLLITSPICENLALSRAVRSHSNFPLHPRQKKAGGFALICFKLSDTTLGT